MTDIHEIRFGGVLFHATDNPDDHHTMTQRLQNHGHQPDQENKQMGEKLIVGANLADSDRPQVYHAGYTPGPDNRRTEDGYKYALPWHCTLDNMSVGDGFLTHAEAIAYADKLAREIQKRERECATKPSA